MDTIITEQYTIDFYRASGDVICEVCSKQYYEHPLEMTILDYNNEPFLHRLCNGDLVKL